MKKKKKIVVVQNCCHHYVVVDFDFENDELLITDEINLKDENSSYFKQFPEIIDLKVYKVRVELYNEYTKSWEMFYEREYDLNGVDDWQKDGHYNFPVHKVTDVDYIEGLKVKVIENE